MEVDLSVSTEEEEEIELHASEKSRRKKARQAIARGERPCDYGQKAPKLDAFHVWVTRGKSSTLVAKCGCIDDAYNLFCYHARIGQNTWITQLHRWNGTRQMLESHLPHYPECWTITTAGRSLLLSEGGGTRFRWPGFREDLEEAA